MKPAAPDFLGGGSSVKPPAAAAERRLAPRVRAPPTGQRSAAAARSRPRQSAWPAAPLARGAGSS
eukprot:6241234-Prymnesium_polylepis.1